MTKTEQIDLASASPFRVGLLTAEPALRQVSATTTTTSTETLQPRVMQVLVALARANGAIISRDALVQQCWEGRIVGDDSINRVISRLRRLSIERGGGSFQIETVPRVGYRLIGEVALVPPSQSPPLKIEQQRARSALMQNAFVVGAALLAAIAGIISLATSRTTPPTPALAVATFATSPDLADTAQTLHDAVVSASPPERLKIVGGQGSISDYQLTGRLVRSPDGLTLYPQLRAPGATTAIWTPQKRFAANAPLAGVGAQLAAAARCIIEGEQEKPVKPSVAISAWAHFCDAMAGSQWEPNDVIEVLRVATRAEPRFVSAQVSLASVLSYQVMHQGGRDPARLRDEAAAALSVVERQDPQNSRIYLARSILTPLTDFGSREHLIARAARSRHDGWGDEETGLGFLCESVGRLHDAENAYKRALTIVPNDPKTSMVLAEVLSMEGRYSEGRSMFERAVATEPDQARIDRIWLTAAITGQDWASARRLIASIPNDRERAAMGPLLTALAAGDRRTAFAAGRPFEQIAADSSNLTALTVMALAWSGRSAAAIDAAERRFRSVGYNNSIGALYSPGFAAARITPEFEAMTKRIGLMTYWKSSHEPDFCHEANRPSLCRRLYKS